MRGFVLLAALLSLPSFAGESTIAVASNFKDVAETLAADYRIVSGDAVRISAASTGKLYAQIVNGAPFDVLLAADAVRPQLLEEEGRAVAGSRFTYARGTLILWAPAASGDCLALLKSGVFDHMAIANPVTAPYGAAAQQVLQKLGLEKIYAGRIVTGENISQAMQFVDSGAAPAGFVAKSQWLANDRHTRGCSWEADAQLFAPIDQQAVLLTRGADSPAAGFLKYLRTDAAAKIIRAAGYVIPE